MRALAAALFFPAASAGGWDFTPVPICTLWQEGPETEMRVTYDPSLPEPYAIAVSTKSGWGDPAVFSIQFEGPLPLTISTDRHRISSDRETLVVSDRGFGNVLNGLEFNLVATALGGTTAIPFSLVGAPQKVQAFRDCATSPVA